MRRLYITFLVSGVAALLYQLIWQRSLFAIFGINVEAVTVVVTAFMLGLGLGSYLGGLLSQDPGRPALLIFSAIETGIGLCGLASLAVFRWVGEVTLEWSSLARAAATLGLLLIPTLLMGATLPILVGYEVRLNQNVGKSVGSLYFVNTLGSAVGCLAAVLFFLGTLGQQNTVRIAALMNFLVAGLALLEHRRQAGAHPGAPLATAGSPMPVAPAPRLPAPDPVRE